MKDVSSPRQSTLSSAQIHVRSTCLQINSTVMSLRVCGTVFTVKNSKSSHLKYCYCVLKVWRVDEPAVSFHYDPSIHKNMLNYNALYFKWPLTSSPSFLFSPPIPLRLPLSGFISQNTITCARVHIILRFWPVCHQFCFWMFTHG